ncbi:transaldolase [Candidatus Magnetominusculus xianensis]|uniref:Transaldolase n=1 Tax=Candidatus Magnetominusculus xianensis TaxID=1748249 RepID=A0ABR5SP14_9BACT|nr:transaldolase [Candidatus Magnetominusculus xianensis]KWT94668.1 transaldolase [Candidatus Magnetominusculus xianensis]MBF0403380.1 transaldolase [Nitrospirota bacterium]
MAVNPLVELHKAGQSFWYDNISRGLINSGALKQLIDQDGVRGITSNPSIFYKAIKDGADYNGQLAELFKYTVLTAKEILYKLEIADIASAADALLPIYESSKGVDGYVSIEVDPRFAHDAEKTISEAREIAKLIGRPNIMIKVPATKEGLKAITQLTAEGLNVNATLLFSVVRYAEVANAYLDGLKKCLNSGKPIDNVASVASFFISRIDTAVDKILDNRTEHALNPAEKEWAESLKGKAAISCAKAAYQTMILLFSSDKYIELKHKGGKIQRLLWASTSTKNPRYPDCLYVESLIGPNTINTMPVETVKAFKDHGKVSRAIDFDLKTVDETLDSLTDLNINLETIAQTLEDEGVKQFIDAFEALLTLIEDKRKNH